MSWSRERARAVLATFATLSLAAASLPIVLAQPALGADLPAGGFDWNAARGLPPLQGTADSSAELSFDEVRAPTCVDGQCVSTTVRPELEATIEPDPDDGYTFAVFDLSGIGGLSAPVAEASVHDQATWAPEAGLLEHGRVYAWTVIGADDERQDWQILAVDLQRRDDQGFDQFGMLAVGMGTGELAMGVDLHLGEDELGLSLEYRTSDAGGTTPRHVVSPGWQLRGPALGDASWYALDLFGDGATVIAKSGDGSSVRYERDADGAYHPPRLDGFDSQHVYPALEVRGDEWVMTDLDGGVSSFASDGSLQRYSREAPDGSATIAIEPTWSGGLLTGITDAVTGRSASFRYMGDRACRAGPGFDTGSLEPALCGVTTFAGDVVEIHYSQGRLARVVAPGGAVTDFAYDASDRLVAVRDPLAADAVAGELVGNDLEAAWRIDYDASGRVQRISSPSPAPGADPLVRSYTYDHGATTISVGGAETATLTFDPDDYRLFTARTAGADLAHVRLYDDDRRPIGFVDERGLQTAWETDSSGNITSVWGPAPTSWFDDDARPLPAYAARIGTTTTTYGGGSGMLALFFDGLAVDAVHSAQRLLTSATLGSLPASVDASDGWRMTIFGEARVDLDTESLWRIDVDERADRDASLLSVNGQPCAVGEHCTVAEPTEQDPDGQLLSIGVTYARPDAPTQGSPAWFSIEFSQDGGETWQELDVAAMRGRDLPTSSTAVDVYEPAGSPVVTSAATTYADPLLGLVGSEAVDGAVHSWLSYEPADPNGGLFARQTALKRASGLETTIDYWGISDVVPHPVTGESLPQLGRLRSVQVGDGDAHGHIYDATGELVAVTTDEVVTTALVLDDRSRISRLVVTNGGHELSPDRSLDIRYGAGGDPRVTGVTSVIGSDTYTQLTTVDLLGRVTRDVDVWGTTTTTTYDEFGMVSEITSEAPDGARSTTHHTRSAAGSRLESVTVDAADGSTYRADVTDHDRAGRWIGVEYSNGVSLTVTNDPVTGLVESNRWVDGDGGVWLDALSRTEQRGRVLGHTLDGPSSSASFSYRYDPSTGFLIEAVLEGQMPTTWTYAYDGVDGARTQRVTTTPDETVTLDYGYNHMLAPVSLTETTAPTSGEPTVREVPVGYQGDDMVAFDGIGLVYDIEGLLVGAYQDDTTVELTRDAAGNVISQHVVDASGSSTYLYGGPFVLDENGATLAEIFELPGGVTVEASLVDGGGWHASSLTGDPWFTTDAGGRAGGEVSHFSPDGERLSGPGAEPHDVDAGRGWRSGADGYTIGLDSPVVVFGERAYIPALGMFTTMDPVPNAGPTPYSYADNDAVNLIDPSGRSSEGPFDTWTSPGWQAVITIGAYALAIGLTLTGHAWAASLVLTALAAYYGYLSYLAFEDGDYIGGTAYAITAALTLVAAGGLVVKGTKTGNLAWAKATRGRSGTISVAPTRPASFSSVDSLGNTSWMFDTSSLPIMTHVLGKRAMFSFRVGNFFGGLGGKFFFGFTGVMTVGSVGWSWFRLESSWEP